MNDLIEFSKTATTSKAADTIREYCNSLTKNEMYEFIHTYISSGGVLDPLYIAVGEPTVKDAKSYIISKILSM